MLDDLAGRRHAKAKRSDSNRFELFQLSCLPDRHASLTFAGRDLLLLATNAAFVLGYRRLGFRDARVLTTTATGPRHSDDPESSGTAPW